ncbi:hypothetical protein MCOR25_002821 [Pyricularia grisea]|uniref:ATP synthase subunit K, mitochondrial n=1 Tax=Pyricularia grisea TaxID=148305 RepID=A0A6P8B9R2_PYRGI|nr:hypothetical protein PpBr36_01224 [Pyricularia pennisetigena]XP_030983940.1 uncharacterized protein PgNI_03787 [Pyricularia grisea]KAI6376186.1 hypothetical protein MCOR25_002821 [Pyricularia grisea]TLD12583.1 hypothetical protein PgNI_03787 [Pyricularia grisea]TLS27813.1 hypothetical protein PpBr36_01224 [Pyricularia pennisetigena]
MVQYYQIAGRKVGSHYLAMGVLTAMFGGVYASLSGPSKVPKAGTTPPINAASSDEADFIKKFLEDNSGKGKSEGKH